MLKGTNILCVENSRKMIKANIFINYKKKKKIVIKMLKCNLNRKTDFCRTFGTNVSLSVRQNMELHTKLNFKFINHEISP